MANPCSQYSLPPIITYLTPALFCFTLVTLHLVTLCPSVKEKIMVLETITLNASQWSPGSSPVTSSRQDTPASTTPQLRAATMKSSLSKPLAQREYERDRLRRKCVGRQVHVVNLMSLMPAWPKDIHSQEILDEVNVEIDEWLKT